MHLDGQPHGGGGGPLGDARRPRPGRRHTALARLFGEETGDEVDKFARVAWRPGPGGVPVLDDCTSWFVGRALERIPVGDHTAVVLEPVEAAHAPGLRPLRFAAVKDMAPGHPA